MIRFLLKGLVRDHHRSLFPILVVTLGVALTVLMQCWITGMLGELVDNNATFLTGHVKVMSRAYAENVDQMPNDLALTGVENLINNLENEFPDMTWVKRTRFAGLLDVPDEFGETKVQGPAVGMAVDLLSKQSLEIKRLNIKESLIRGRLPRKSGEILISDELATKFGIEPGGTVTLLGSTMYGGMVMQNYTIAGTILFGIGVMDRGAMIMDITDAQIALDMEDATGEILGYFKTTLYNDVKAEQIASQFNAHYSDLEDEFSPFMVKLKDQNELAGMLDYMDSMKVLFISLFVMAMSIVLWNAGLIGGLRRYGEVGLRLAIGEHKGQVYRSMIYESILIGFFGSVFGTVIGLAFAYYLQIKGINIGAFMKNATMMLPNIYRAHIIPDAYYIGFLPGLFSTVLGTVLSGIGIYRRKTAQLFKELEA